MEGESKNFLLYTFSIILYLCFNLMPDLHYSQSIITKGSCITVDSSCYVCRSSFFKQHVGAHSACFFLLHFHMKHENTCGRQNSQRSTVLENNNGALFGEENLNTVTVQKGSFFFMNQVCVLFKSCLNYLKISSNVLGFVKLEHIIDSS